MQLAIHLLSCCAVKVHLAGTAVLEQANDGPRAGDAARASADWRWGAGRRELREGQAPAASGQPRKRGEEGRYESFLSLFKPVSGTIAAAAGTRDPSASSWRLCSR
jgi:hypothetical protein